MLSGIGVGECNLSEDNMRAIAIRSSVYTKLNPKWAEIFPELNTDHGEWTGEQLSTIQSQGQSELNLSSSFSTALTTSSSSMTSVSISPPSSSSRPASEKIQTFPTSPSKNPMATPSTSILVENFPVKRNVSPPKTDDSKLNGSGGISDSDEIPINSQVNRPASSKNLLSIPRSFDSRVQHSSSSSAASPPLADSDINSSLSFYSTDDGKLEIYSTVLSHLKSTIPGWVVSLEEPSSTMGASRLSSPVRVNSGRGLSNRVEHLTHNTNPNLTIIEVYLQEIGTDEGISAQDGQQSKAVWCKMRADFGTWHKIRTNTADWSGLDSNMPEGEAQREHARQLIVQVLDGATSIAWSKLNVRLTFSDIDLSGTEGSMRAVFQGIGPGGQTFARETEVMRLNLSSTRTSPRSLLSLHKLCNLQELLLDHCPSIQKSGKNVFSLLLKKDSIPSLTSLSVVGTSQVMSVTWIAEVEQRCPNLKRLYFTRQPGVKALGWSDNVMMQTMRDPLLLPCGHIGDRASLLSLGYCAFDRQAFRISELASLNPNITLLEKEEDGKWNATIVDAQRKPLDPKVLYHRQCGSFYNLDTLKDIYDLEDINEVSQDLIDSIRAQSCHYCQKQFGSNTRICFPHSAEPSEKQAFDNLKDVSNYGSLLSGSPQGN
jgi:hypothetical protein